MLKDNILDEILSKVSWETSASTYKMIIDDLKSGELSETEFKGFLKSVCKEWGDRVEAYYMFENGEE